MCYDDLVDDAVGNRTIICLVYLLFCDVKLQVEGSRYETLCIRYIYIYDYTTHQSQIQGSGVMFSNEQEEKKSTNEVFGFVQCATLSYHAV